MACIITFTASPFDAEPLLVADVFALSINEEAAHYGTAEVEIPVELGVRQYLRAVVSSVENSADRILFDGYVYEFRPGRESIKLTLREQTAIFERAVVQATTTVSGTLAQAVSALLMPYNVRTSGAWSVVTSISTSVSKECKAGDTYFDVFTELAELAWVPWRAKNGVVEFGYGIDYTSGTDFREVVYNGRSPQESTVASVETVYTGEVVTHLLATDGTSTTSVEDTGSAFGRLEAYQDFRSGSLAQQAQAHLDRYKTGERAYTIVPEEGIEVATPGDTVRLRIEGVNEYVNFEGSMDVTKRSTQLVGGKLAVTYELGKVMAPTPGIVGLLRALKADARKGT